MNRKLWWAACLLAAGLTAGCQTDAPRNDLAMCTDPRPQICTREYMPVCGHVGYDDSWKTYGNACSACGDPAVDGWMAGACPES